MITIVIKAKDADAAHALLQEASMLSMLGMIAIESITNDEDVNTSPYET